MYGVANSRYALRLRQPIARSLLEVLRSRFDHVSASVSDGTVLIVDDLDQAAVRAVLTLLWDTGHEVLSFAEANHERAGPDQSQQRQNGLPAGSA